MVTRMEHDLKPCRAASARVIALNKAVSAQRRPYPRLMIGGVDRASFAMGLTVYALPACARSISRHRARATMRRARQAFQQTLTPSGADVARDSMIHEARPRRE